MILKKLSPVDKLCRACEESLYNLNLQHNESVPLEVASEDNAADAQETLPSQEIPSYSSNSFGSLHQTKSQEINAVKQIFNLVEINSVNQEKMSKESLKLTMEQLLLEISEKITDRINIAYDLNINIFDHPVTKNIITDRSSLKDIIDSMQNR